MCRVTEIGKRRDDFLDEIEAEVQSLKQGSGKGQVLENNKNLASSSRYSSDDELNEELHAELSKSQKTPSPSPRPSPKPWPIPRSRVQNQESEEGAPNRRYLRSEATRTYPPKQSKEMQGREGESAREYDDRPRDRAATGARQARIQLPDAEVPFFEPVRASAEGDEDTSQPPPTERRDQYDTRRRVRPRRSAGKEEPEDERVRYEKSERRWARPSPSSAAYISRQSDRPQRFYKDPNRDEESASVSLGPLRAAREPAIPLAKGKTQIARGQEMRMEKERGREREREGEDSSDNEPLDNLSEIREARTPNLMSSQEMKSSRTHRERLESRRKILAAYNEGSSIPRRGREIGNDDMQASAADMVQSSKKAESYQKIVEQIPDYSAGWKKKKEQPTATPRLERSFCPISGLLLQTSASAPAAETKSYEQQQNT
jgi:hypothetical protein